MCPVFSTETTPRRSPIVILTLHARPIIFILFVSALLRKQKQGWCSKEPD